MKIDSALSFVVNLMCHVFILVVFLTVFFFLFITKMTTEHIDSELKSLIGEQTYDLLVKLYNTDSDKLINWTKVETTCINLEPQYRKEMQFVTDNNNHLYNDTINFILMFGFSIFVLISYLSIRKFTLNLKFMAFENIVIFLFVGMIEIYFFLNIASKYVPVLPDEAITSVIGRLEYLLHT